MNISIITCSRSSTLSQDKRENIASTIHKSIESDINKQQFEYEIITIDNSENRYNIFQAYNQGIQLASGDILCFQHDDIEYLSQGWGDKVVELMDRHPEVGGCSVVGSTYLKKCPSYYITKGQPSFIKINLTQNGIHYHDFDKECPIVAFDGLWFCIRRKCFEQIHFDEKTYHGFHMYDMDISMQLATTGYKLCTIPDVNICHKGSQTWDLRFWQNALLFYHKWHDYLPLAVEGQQIDPSQQYKYEREALYTFFRNTIRFHQWNMLLQFPSIAAEILDTNKLSAIVMTISDHFQSSRKK